MKLEKAFRNQEKIKFERAKSGDPAFLLAELERAHKSLKKVIDKDENTRGRANTAQSSTSVGAGGYNTSIN